MEGRLLWSVGRGRDALVWLQRGHDVDPLHNGENWSLALNLAAEGHAADSQALLAKMETQWPHQMSTRDARFRTSLVTGATGDVLAKLADPAARPIFMDQQSIDACSAALKAGASKDPEAKAAAIEMVK